MTPLEKLKAHSAEFRKELIQINATARNYYLTVAHELQTDKS